MALEKSTMLALGTTAPDFNLTDTVSGDPVALGDLEQSKALVVIFLCNHCPYVVHIQQGLVNFGNDYAGADVAIVGISANDAVTYPDDGPERLGAVARERGYTFPVLFDETQEVAKAYTAACTPDFFLFGPDRELAYRGRFDRSRPNSGIPVTGEDLRSALDAVLADRAVTVAQYPSMGCSIKWKPGNEPI
ncbi:MAG: thioredoxin family protein [bacterium]|nr:thioredoxin family protein [bacterium]MDE0287383.1 thioredoxin family protein [bacterium]MDE0438386.1 thioredoxin family protein [bacterium]